MAMFITVKKRVNKMSINRRSFLKATASMSAFFLSGTIAATVFEAQAGQVESTVDYALAVERSIKAHFGSGFSVLSQSHKGELALVEIEHLGNRYSVRSSNLSNWKILSSTIE